MKTYIVSSVFLFGVPAAHRGSNNNCQYTIVVRAKNQKRVGEILGQSVWSLRQMGLHLAGPKHEEIAKKEEQIYYHPAHTRTGYIDKWFEYHPYKPSIPA
jgi:hypothetical protein